MSGAQPQDEPSVRSSYRRVFLLASGGVGTVELAVREEGRFRRLYAIKRLRDVYREDDDFREMFLDEARIAGLLRHPNVVSVLDVGEDDRGPFLVMDYVDGVSGAALIRRAVSRRQTIPLQVCLRIAMEAAEGLHAAHELRDPSGHPMQLVHRDVSPQNLLIGYDGITRVADFGIAKALGRATRTQTGVLKGKFGYMSPEQLRFEEPDRRSDLFSLGVVLFELASGQRLYKNVDGMDGARRILNEPPPDLGDYRDDVPAELVQLLFSMLAKESDHRPGDARTVARSLEAILSDLVAEEGRVEVGAYVQDSFARERAEQEQRLSEALESGELGPISVSVALGEPTAPGGQAGTVQGRRLFGVAALAFVLLAGAGAAAWWLGADPRGPVDPGLSSGPVEVAAPASALEGPAAPRAEGDGEGNPAGVALAPEGAGTEGEPAEGQEAQEGHEGQEAQEEQEAQEGHEGQQVQEPAPGDEGAEGPTASERTRAAERRRARRRRQRARGEGTSGVPMWDWQ